MMDLGWRRGRAAIMVGGVAIVLGLPSALSMAVFKNQDWVWGLGLLLSGALFALATIIHGVGRMRREVNVGSDGPRLGLWFDATLYGAIPMAFIAMLSWWLTQAVSWDPDGWWDPLASTSLGTCLAQWGLAALGLVALNRWLVRRLETGKGAA